MSNNNKEKIYFAAATNLITMVVVIFMPLLFGECELSHWYFSKLSFDKENALSKWIMILLLLAMAIIVILFFRGLGKTDFVSSSVQGTNKTNSERIAERQRLIMLEQEKLAAKKMKEVKYYLLDLRHLAWNIGKRLDWNGNQCATFIKICFHLEMKDLEIETIRRNLRQKGSCIIERDVPENDSYEFHSVITE